MLVLARAQHLGTTGGELACLKCESKAAFSLVIQVSAFSTSLYANHTHDFEPPSNEINNHNSAITFFFNPASFGLPKAIRSKVASEIRNDPSIGVAAKHCRPNRTTTIHNAGFRFLQLQPQCGTTCQRRASSQSHQHGHNHCRLYIRRRCCRTYFPEANQPTHHSWPSFIRHNPEITPRY